MPASLRAKGDILFGTIDSFLVWNLTGGSKGGEHITDVTNASRTMLMNLRTLEWDQELLDLFDIPAAMLPAIRSSSEPYGKATAEPVPGVAITGILGDQQAALVGQTCFDPGDAKNTYGTGCFLLLNTGETPVQSTHGLLTTVAYRFGKTPARYALEGSVAITGALVQWLRDNLGLIQHSADIEALARTVPDNGGVYFVPAFSGLYAPHWNDGARGTIVGLTRFANRGHLARAVLEATAFQTWEVLQAMEKDSGVRLETLRVDGGMTDDDLLMQFQADIVNRPVVRPAMKETTALGAAFAAGLSVGLFRDLDDLRARWIEGRRWHRDMQDDERQRMLTLWTKAVSRSLDWLAVRLRRTLRVFDVSVVDLHRHHPEADQQDTDQHHQQWRVQVVRKMFGDVIAEIPDERQRSHQQQRPASRDRREEDEPAGKAQENNFNRRVAQPVERRAQEHHRTEEIAQRRNRLVPGRVQAPGDAHQRCADGDADQVVVDVQEVKRDREEPQREDDR